MFSFPGRVLGISDKGLTYQGSSASDDARKCQQAREIGSPRASEHTASLTSTLGLSSPRPSAPEQDWPPLRQPPAPFLRKKKPDCERSQGQGSLPGMPTGEGWVLMNLRAVTTGMRPAGARPCLTCGHLAGLGQRGGGGVVIDENTGQFTSWSRSLCCTWPTPGCPECWPGLVGMTRGGGRAGKTDLFQSSPSSITQPWCPAPSWAAAHRSPPPMPFHRVILNAPDSELEVIPQQ